MISRLYALKFTRILIPLSILILCLFRFPDHKLSAAEPANPFHTVLPTVSASRIDNSLSPLVNPVFSDISPSPSISYTLQQFHDQEENYNHFFLTNLAGFIFSYSWIDNLYNYNSMSTEPCKTKMFTIGKGFFFGNTFGFGANYSFNKSKYSKYDDYKSLSLGILLRPFSFLSIGFVSRDLNKPEIYGEVLKRSDIYSVSVKPLSSITFSVDATKYQDQKFDSSDIFYSASLRFIHDISAYAAINRDKDFSFGLRLPLGIPYTNSAELVLDGFARYNKSDIPDSSGFGITLSGQRNSKALIKPKRYLEIVLNDKINEVQTEKLFPFKGKGVIYYDILNAIDTAARDESIIGIIIQIDTAGLGFAQLQELRDQLKLFRNKKKKVYAILNSSGNKEYYLASACDEIIFSPVNPFTLTGLEVEIYFFKEGLDKLGIKFEAVKKGEYKSFAEPYTRKHMSPESMENIKSLLSDLNDQFIYDIINDRKISKKEIDNIFDKGILSPDEALQAGFIDDIDYPLDAEIKILNNNGTEKPRVKLEDFIEEKIYDYLWGPVPEIAIIYVTGSIIHGESRGYSGISPEITSDATYYKALYDAFTDSSVKAIIIRIDSGGGSAVASDLMWHYLHKLKQQYNKPVIFSFGNTAASGGYFIACTGDQILGSRGTVTGSIGVIAGKLSLKELYQKLGINKETIKMSEFADIFSESKDLSSEERAIIQKSVDYSYKNFTEKVSEARGIKKERIDKVAEGRVFTGQQAKANNLIDNYGGLYAAVELAKRIAKITTNFNVRHLPEAETAFTEILGLNNVSLYTEQIAAIQQIFDIIKLNDEHTLYYFPYKLVIK